MFKFPKNLYTDVRIEDVFETNIVYTLGELEESKVRKYKAAFLRVFDGKDGTIHQYLMLIQSKMRLISFVTWQSQM